MEELSPCNVESMLQSFWLEHPKVQTKFLIWQFLIVKQKLENLGSIKTYQRRFEDTIDNPILDWLNMVMSIKPWIKYNISLDLTGILGFPNLMPSNKRWFPIFRGDGQLLKKVWNYWRLTNFSTWESWKENPHECNLLDSWGRLLSRELEANLLGTILMVMSYI